MAANVKKQFELTGWHVLIAIVIFFAVITTVNAIMITLAVKSFPGEEQAKSYMQGLQYNDVLMERHEQAVRGWRVMLPDGTDLPEDETAIRLQLLDETGYSLKNMEISAILGRPATDENDIELTFSEIEDHTYVAEMGNLEPGIWDLKGTATASDGSQITFEKRLWFK